VFALYSTGVFQENSSGCSEFNELYLVLPFLFIFSFVEIKISCLTPCYA
jgi:hypothetical protein